MNERSKLISRLLSERDYRAAYIRAKLDVLVPSQLRALRLRQDKTQPLLAEMAGMKQSRISAMETPGKVNFNLDTLVRMAATLKVGLAVKFVPFSEMLGWENEYSQDTFDVTKLDDDMDFLQPAARATQIHRRARRNRSSRRVPSNPRTIRVPMATGSFGASTYRIPVQQERAQLNLQFEPTEPPPQTQLPNVITLPSRGSSVLNDLPILKAAVGAGRNWRNYGS